MQTNYVAIALYSFCAGALIGGLILPPLLMLRRVRRLERIEKATMIALTDVVTRVENIEADVAHLKADDNHTRTLATQIISHADLHVIRASRIAAGERLNGLRPGDRQIGGLPQARLAVDPNRDSHSAFPQERRESEEFVRKQAEYLEKHAGDWIGHDIGEAGRS